VEQPFELLALIKNAGAIFLGHFTPESVGDYVAGPNHVLPTGGTARFFSPLSTDSFMKKSSLIFYTKEGLDKVGEAVMQIADVEGLEAHGNTIRVRMAKKITHSDLCWKYQMSNLCVQLLTSREPA
jgi:histidinol dehydrogenase